MVNLIRSEWLKQTRRPLTWILLAIFLALLLLQFAQYVFAVSVGRVALNAEQIEEIRKFLALPGALAAVFSHVNGLGGIFAVILTAGVMGSEYSWGTLRTYLARYPGRVTFLLAKLAAILLLLLAAMLITLLAGLLLGWAAGALTGQPGALSASTIAVVPLALARALYVLLPYVLLTLSFTVFGRSLLAGVAGGLVYLVFEAGFGGLITLAQLGEVGRLVYNLIIQANINTLIDLNTRAFGLQPELINRTLDPALFPPPLQATLVIGLYSALFLATALHFFFHRDIAGPS